MRRRRLTATHQITIAAVVLWMLALAGISQASAAQLSVLVGYQAQLITASACADNLDVVPEGRRGQSSNYREVEISAIPSACNGLPLTYILFDSGGNVVVSGDDFAATGTVNIDTGGNYDASSVDSVVVLIGTWPIPTTWSMTTPPAPTGPSCVGIDPATPGQTYPCTFTQNSTTTWTTNGYRYTLVNFDAVTSAPLWEVSFDLSSTSVGFTGMSPVRFVGTYQNVTAAPGYACSSLPSFVGREANPSWGSTNGEITFSDDPGYTAGTTICDV